MKVKKIPMRSCCVSHERLEKKDLIRILRTPDGNVIIDESKKANGRGAYLKKEINVIKAAQKSKILERVLNVKIDDNIYEQALSYVNK